MSTNDLFSKELNPVQAEAAACMDGPLLILAGAGSGKTRVLTYRTAGLLIDGKCSAEQILAVTFTNKAAREMEVRILSLLNNLGFQILDRLWISTFHSTCARILREQLHLLDYQPGWGIYDSSDQLSMIKKVVRSMELKEKEFPAKSIAGRIGQAKMLGLEPHQVEKHRGFIMDKVNLEIYRIYEEEMRRANSLDFSDLLLKTHILFKDYPDILDQYRSKFRYIMVDEYQDTNHIQYLLVKQLAEKHQNICVVGDEDQSIYSWRGADISNILNFEKDFKGAKVVKLEQNYRSTNNIVSAATAVVSNNSQRKDKTLFTDNDDGEKITFSEEGNEYEEARFVGKEIQARVQNGDFTYNDIAVFYRTNAQSRVIEEQFRSDGIAYRMVGGIKFYERKEIKDALSYLKASVNPSDDVAMKRIINVPARGIGKTTVEKVEALATEEKITFLEALRKASEQRMVHAGACKKINQFLNIIYDLIKKSEAMAPTELYQEVLESTGYIAKLRSEDSTEADARIENLEELYNAISQFESERGEEGTLLKFLEEMALVSDADDLDDSSQAVTLMTLHISKGLEYPCVFIVGMEEGLFPSARSNNVDEEAMEEERRLCYVGMTRARQKLFLLCARKRRVWGSEQFNPPSRFIKEIPEEFLDARSSLGRPKFLDRHSSFGSGDFDQTYGDSSNGSYSYDNSFSDDFPDYEGAETTFSDEMGPTYQKGMHVKHPTYGVGSIFKLEGQGDQLRVSVLFRDQTIKKFVAKYARLEMM